MTYNKFQIVNRNIFRKCDGKYIKNIFLRRLLFLGMLCYDLLKDVITLQSVK